MTWPQVGASESCNFREGEVDHASGMGTTARFASCQHDSHSLCVHRVAQAVCEAVVDCGKAGRVGVADPCCLDGGRALCHDTQPIVCSVACSTRRMNNSTGWTHHPGLNP